MCKQTGARFLHRAKNRQDVTFNGLIKVANSLAPTKRASIGIDFKRLDRVSHPVDTFYWSSRNAL